MHSDSSSSSLGGGSAPSSDGSVPFIDCDAREAEPDPFQWPPDDDDEPWAEEYELRCAAELGALLDAADAQLFGEAPAEQPATESGAESRRWAGAACHLRARGHALALPPPSGPADADADGGAARPWSSDAERSALAAPRVPMASLELAVQGRRCELLAPPPSWADDGAAPPWAEEVFAADGVVDEPIVTGRDGEAAEEAHARAELEQLRRLGWPPMSPDAAYEDNVNAAYEDARLDELEQTAAPEQTAAQEPTAAPEPVAAPAPPAAPAAVPRVLQADTGARGGGGGLGRGRIAAAAPAAAPAAARHARPEVGGIARASLGVTGVATGTACRAGAPRATAPMAGTVRRGRATAAAVVGRAPAGRAAPLSAGSSRPPAAPLVVEANRAPGRAATATAQRKPAAGAGAAAVLQQARRRSVPLAGALSAAAAPAAAPKALPSVQCRRLAS
jgi:hypothetical protein